MKAVVFLGPSLARERARGASVESASLELLPPVQQGDVLRALRAGATHIGIVDGFFDQVPSVWHKEILFAIEQGVVVYGAASMGALRAAELHTFGMIGVGRIFEMYRDGVLEDDDEVAMLHGAASSGYRAASEAMVNLRDRLDAAVLQGLLGRAEADALARALKAQPYPMRTYRLLAELAPALASFLREPYPSLKERDALALLERMAKSEPDAPGVATFRVERTIFLERLRLEVMREGAAGIPSAAPTEEGAVRRRRALLGLLAEEHVALTGGAPSAEDVDAAVEDFQRAHGLLTPEAMEAWLAARGVSVDAFFELAREEATVKKLEALYAAEIDRRLVGSLPWA